MENHPSRLPKVLAGINLLMTAGAVALALFFGRYRLLLPTLPLLVIATWLAVLARWTWRQDRRAAVGTWVTQGFFLLVGISNIAFGLYANEAARQSAAHGGGLLGGFGSMLIIFGVALMIPSALCLLLVGRLHFR